MSEPAEPTNRTASAVLPGPGTAADPDVAIVGAGPAGLLLGLLLGRRGRRVLLIEREAAPEIGGPGNGICPILQPATLGILDDLGLLPDLARGTTPVTHGEVVAGGAVVAGYAYAGLPDAPVDYALPTSIIQLRDVLTVAVRATPGVEIVYGATVHGLPARDDVTAGASRGLLLETAEGTRTLRPSLIVGCDGKRSAVRDMAGISSQVTEFRRGYLELRLPMPEFWGGMMRAYFTSDGYMLGTPIADDRLLLVWITDEETAGRAADGPFDELVERYAKGVPDAADWIRAHAHDRSQLREFPHHIVRPDRWVDGNVLLVGDSAHGVHVYGGQGLNLSLQDAACLADAVDRALTEADTAELHRFEAVRMPFVSAFQDMQELHLAALAARSAGQGSTQGGRRSGGGQQGGGHLPEFAPLALGQPELRDALAAAGRVPAGSAGGAR
ncbi:FAD-dependent oxidoreductase [Streptomyces sp. NPDC056491]|uniref:FAD-dependent oxidoreductase n=1 Tax=Streptomyces sp. NPDC056491 TaxID=3345837 RepID=UPI00368D32F0